MQLRAYLRNIFSVLLRIIVTSESKLLYACIKPFTLLESNMGAGNAQGINSLEICPIQLSEELLNFWNTAKLKHVACSLPFMTPIQPFSWHAAVSPVLYSL
ncbi:Hypothetical predicted protein [Podarcis lilfordi]|uniref:Uncharacterized protein n=1 Tax=Podarcis lilfordi TaxID=74358 RepID=A0AA35NWA4_9SAUR|nr:Hypothetical predicted protein [Podarcis lilfordi]